MAIDNLYTSATYNSYFADIVDLDSFVSALDGFWNLTSWNLLTDTQKENIMHGATSDFNNFCFNGSINGSIKSPFNMQFPRSDLEYKNGVDILNNEIPVFTKEYIAERVLEKNANKENGKFYDGRIKKYALGKLTQEFHSPRDSRLMVKSLKNFPSYSRINFYVCGLSGNFKYVQRA